MPKSIKGAPIRYSSQNADFVKKKNWNYFKLN